MEIEFSLSIIVGLGTRCTFRGKENNDRWNQAGSTYHYSPYLTFPRANQMLIDTRNTRGLMT